VLPNNSYFQHLTYDRRRNVLYAGAMNRILQLNRNLTVLSQATTGPKPDSPQCHAGGCTDDMETTETNNYNKILMLDDAGDTLIACGSIHQGACEIYNNLNLFPESYKYLDIPLAANDENSSTYAFIGPSRYAAWKKEDILYVGTTFTNVGDYRHDVPAISSRKLDDLNYAEFSIQQSNINIDVKYRDHFLVDYIYGFNSSDFAYFVLVQKKSHLAEEAGFQTRLARICVNDPNYDSYTEITIQCLSHSVDGSGNSAEHFYNDRTNEYHYPQQQQPPQSGAGGGFLPGYQDFNVMRDAKITRAGQRLSQSMGIKKDDPVLVAIFSPSKEITNEPQNTSAMCVYSLKEIEEVFTENIHMCFNGSIKDRNLGYISGMIMDGKCPAVGSYGNIYNFCSVGLKISGVAPIVAHSLFTFENESVTSVTTATTGPHTLAFLGTSEGTIKKVMISGPLPGEYEKIDVDPGNQILPDTQLSPKQDYLYVLSRKKVSLILLHLNRT
jgi:plexin A